MLRAGRGLDKYNCGEVTSLLAEERPIAIAQLKLAHETLRDELVSLRK
jgi:hypothetical protein